MISCQFDVIVVILQPRPSLRKIAFLVEIEDEDDLMAAQVLKRKKPKPKSSQEIFVEAISSEMDKCDHLMFDYADCSS